LSASTIARLKEVWIDEHKRWNERDLSAKRYVYVWADGIHLQARLEHMLTCAFRKSENVRCFAIQAGVSIPRPVPALRQAVLETRSAPVLHP
jgi:hypothetical protein